MIYIYIYCIHTIIYICLGKGGCHKNLRGLQSTHHGFVVMMHFVCSYLMFPFILGISEFLWGSLRKIPKRTARNETSVMSLHFSMLRTHSRCSSHLRWGADPSERCYSKFYITAGNQRWQWQISVFGGKLWKFIYVWLWIGDFALPHLSTGGYHVLPPASRPGGTPQVFLHSGPASHCTFSVLMSQILSGYGSKMSKTWRTPKSCVNRCSSSKKMV